MALLTRADLQSALTDILGSGNVYYEPPETVKLKYPCIIYNLARMHNRSADNYGPWIRYDSYTVMYICSTVQQTRHEDSVPEKLLQLRGCVFDRTFVTDNLHHYVFTIYLG